MDKSKYKDNKLDHTV